MVLDTESIQISSRRGSVVHRPKEPMESFKGGPRLINDQLLTAAWRSKIEETLLPFAWAPLGMEPEVDRSSYKDAMSLIRYFIPVPLATTYPHSVYDGEHYLFFWGTHTNEPVRGLAVRKHDGKMMLWDVDGNHLWDDEADGKQVTRSRNMVKAYFFGKDEWEAREAKMAETNAKISKTYNERIKAELKKRREAQPGPYPQGRNRKSSSKKPEN